MRRSLHDRIPTAEQYYRVTADSFRALCPEDSGYMNMGMWPARSIREAQEALVRFALERAKGWWERGEVGRDPLGVLDLGSGWGASRPLFDEAFPRTPYVGVNVSAPQVEAARIATAAIPNTAYVVSRVEDQGALPWDGAELLFSIEAAFHFEDKGTLLRAAVERGVRLFTLLEICVEDPAVTLDPLLAPSLRNAWATRRYQDGFAALGFQVPCLEDVSDRVFSGFLTYIESIDDRTFRGRRAVLDQLRRATRAIASAAARGAIRYVLLQAAAA